MKLGYFFISLIFLPLYCYSDNLSTSQQEELMQGYGRTTLTFIDLDTKESHTLHTKGPVYIDDVKNVVSMQKEDSEIGSGEQVIFNDRVGQIKADHVILNFEKIKGNITSKKLILTGNVQILQHAPLDPKDKKEVMQYALADSVEFHPKTQEMVLSATCNRRVLFFDKVQEYQMSAEEVILYRSPTTKKEVVQGKGRVRFSFDDSEIIRLKKIFQFGDKVIKHEE